MLLVLAIVLSLDFLFAFIGEMDELASRYQVFEALVFVITTLPRRIYDYLPLGAFMGCLVGLGAMAKNSELVVIRAAGVSTGRIVLSAMKPALVVVLIGLLLGEFVAPFTEKIAQSQRAVLQGAESNVASHQGLWHREGDTFMHFNAVEPNGVLHGVSLQYYDAKRELHKSRFAKRAIYQRGAWLLEDVVETRFIPSVSLSPEKVVPIKVTDSDARVTGDEARIKTGKEGLGRTVVARYASLPWPTELSPSVLSVLIVKPDNLSISGLYTYANYLREQDLSSAEYMMSFWKKILQPVSTAVLVLVAISFVFGPLRSVTMGFRVFSGVVVGLLFKYAQDLLGPSSLVFGFNPIYATLVPIIVCFCVGFWFLRRAK
jgi:lipopolysaccharide export system permease protein